MFKHKHTIIGINVEACLQYLRDQLNKDPEWASQNLEVIAQLCHSQWAGWMEYLFSKSTHNIDGSITIPPELVARWRRQTAASYEELPENEKQSDRVEARKFFRLFGLIEGQTQEKEQK